MIGSSLRCALIVRSSNRGLGVQSRALHRWLQPHKTLLVDTASFEPNHQQHPDWYPDAKVTGWDGHRFADPAAARWLTHDVDLILSVETFYDWGLIGRARDRRIRTVLYANPEFYRCDRDPSVPRPDATFAPTAWRLDLMPGVAVLPMPVDRAMFPPRHVSEIGTVVHVGGTPAARDRNGTLLFMAALRWMRSKVTARITCQRPGGSRGRLGGGVTLDTRCGDAADPADLYAGADALILPRRYGGNCLPMLEAASLGLPVVSLDVAPQSGWFLPDTLIPARVDRRVTFQGGEFDVASCDPRLLAEMIDRLIGDPELIGRASKQSDVWAETNSWERLLPIWQTTLEQVAA